MTPDTFYARKAQLEKEIAEFLVVCQEFNDEEYDAFISEILKKHGTNETYHVIGGEIEPGHAAELVRQFIPTSMMETDIFPRATKIWWFEFGEAFGSDWLPSLRKAVAFATRTVEFR